MNTGNRDGDTQPEVTVSCENTEPPSWLNRYISFVQSILIDLGYQSWSMSVVLTDPETIQQLNRDYREMDYATDVLSFAQWEGPEVPRTPGQGPLSDLVEAGDIVIAPDVVRNNAEEFGVTFEEELRRVTIHGILHLAGYGHDTNDVEKESMLQWQEQLVSSSQKEKLF